MTDNAPIDVENLIREATKVGAVNVSISEKQVVFNTGKGIRIWQKDASGNWREVKSDPLPFL